MARQAAARSLLPRHTQWQALQQRLCGTNSSSISKLMGRRQLVPTRPLRPLCSASAAPGDSADDDASHTGSRAWRLRPPAVALPAALKGPGRWFLLAGVLKVLQLTHAHSPLAHTFVVLGFALPEGLATLLATLPVALALVYAAKTVLDRGWLKLRWTAPLVVLASVALLAVCSAASGRPKAAARARAEAAARQQAHAKEAARTASMARRTAADADRLLAEYDAQVAERARLANQRKGR